MVELFCRTYVPKGEKSYQYSIHAPTMASHVLSSSFPQNKEGEMHMRPSRKLITKLPPTFLVWMVLLCSACGTGSKETITAPQKAPASQQVFVDPEVGVADIATFD